MTAEPNSAASAIYMHARKLSSAGEGWMVGGAVCVVHISGDDKGMWFFGRGGDAPQGMRFGSPSIWQAHGQERAFRYIW